MSLQEIDLINSFKSIGIKKSDSILIHSSLSSFGFVEGGADTVINSIINVIGDEGTLIVPTLTGRVEDSPINPPVFNVLNTSCWTGRIAETLRKMNCSRRSLHPTHSAAAIGSNKEFVTSGHENSKTPCDEYSPYYKNYLLKGHILLVGVDQESNTSVHCCEEMAKVPYHLQKEITNTNITGYNGEKICVSNYLHDWNKPHTDFNNLEELYIENGIMKKYRVGNAQVRLIDTKSMFDFTIELLRKNPLFLLVHPEEYK